MRRKWCNESTLNPNTPELSEWIERTVRDSPADLSNPVHMDRLLLSRKPSQRATRYSRMIAFGNHFRVADESTVQLVTYNSGVASLFHEPAGDAGESLVNYVGVLKDVLELDYGAVHTRIILLRCEWVNTVDRRGNPTYTRDESGFLVVNFRHLLPRMAEPFIFPTQAMQVFFSNVVDRPGWKVVLQKDARTRREVLDTTDAFITTNSEADGLTAPRIVPIPASAVNLVGAMELSREDSLVAQQGY